MTQDISLQQKNEELVDGENNLITHDISYDIRGNLLEPTIREIKQIHGETVKFLPLSAKSAGGGVFQTPAPNGETIVGLHLSATLNPRIHRAADIDIRKIDLDEILINEMDHSIYAGASITLQQLNQALRDQLGPQYQVLGADLTSLAYAQVGSTFMTGGMGPQRRYFCDSVVEIALHNGDRIVKIAGDELPNYAGTYGWTGLVSAVKCVFHELPIEEFAFSIPVKNTPGDLARVLSHFAKFVYFDDTPSGKLHTKDNLTTMIMGLEHVTVGSMQPLLKSQSGHHLTNIATDIVDKCKLANADGVIFVYGLSDLSIDEALGELVDDLTSEDLTIADVNLEHTYNFATLSLMHELREAVSYAARHQKPIGNYSYKGHTDANIRVNPGRLVHSITDIWSSYQNYIQAVESYFNARPMLKGEILIYGHLNPCGFDPHNRITFVTDDKSSYHESIKTLDEFKHKLILELAKICNNTGSVFTGGEKGAGSDHELLIAFDNLESVPEVLLEKYLRQKVAIENASAHFNWRAIGPYR